MTEVEIYSDTADEPIAAHGKLNQSQIYSSLTAEQLITLLVAGSDSFAASHEEQPVPLSSVDLSIEVGGGASQGYNPSTNYFEQYPIQQDGNIGLGGVGNETVQEVVERANDEVVQPIVPNNLTSPPISTLRINSESHTCPHCGVQNPTRARLRQHLVSHEPAKLICSTCAIVIKRKGDMERHMKLHDEKWVSCPTCAIVFKRQDDLDKHVELHKDSWDCDGAVKGPCGDDGCGKSFTRKDAMVRHCRRKRRAVKG